MVTTSAQHLILHQFGNVNVKLLLKIEEKK
jgi:hypothetical protein